MNLDIASPQPAAKRDSALEKKLDAYFMQAGCCHGRMVDILDVGM
jgi:hypothetical protein